MTKGNIKNKRPLLMKGSERIKTRHLDTFYQEEDQITYLNSPGETPKPLALAKDFAITESKTMAAPGDDDPDPDIEACY